MASVERCELLPGNRVRWVLQEKVDKGIRFKADYIVTYEGDGSEHVSWRSLRGTWGTTAMYGLNPWQAGAPRFATARALNRSCRSRPSWPV